jgi:hypothetical protein
MLPSLIYPAPLRMYQPSHLLGDPSSYACGANIHPLLSLVSYQLFSPCCLTRPEDIPQIKLHIYIDDITTSAVPSDTISVPCKKNRIGRCLCFRQKKTRVILLFIRLILYSFNFRSQTISK